MLNFTRFRKAGSNTGKRKAIGYSLFFAIATVFLFTAKLQAQSSANYTFSTNTNASLVLANATTVDMSSGTTLLVAAGLDATASSVTNIGFDFFIGASRFTQFSVQDDGLVQLGGTAVSTNTYTIANGTLALPNLAAFNADLRTGATSGKVHSKVFGSAGSRVLVIEFLNMQVFYATTAAAGTCTYQVRLYENTGVIEFVYGAMSVTDASSATNARRRPAIGFYVGSAAGSFASVAYATNTSATSGTYASNPVVSATGTIAALNSASDGSRRFYKYAPPVAAAPTALTFSNVTSTSMKLNWTASSPVTSVLKYAIYMSSDGGTTYNYVSTVNVGTNTYTASGLTGGTTYLWRVYALSEGALSTALAGTRATPLPPTISSVTVPSNACTASSHVINANIVANSGTVSTVTLNYNNGSAGSTAMTLTTGNTYTGTIPAGTAGTAVTWSITATNSSGGSATFNGTGYTDDPFAGSGITALASASATTVCSGSTANLTAILFKPSSFQVGSGTSTAGSATGAFTNGRSFYSTAWGNAREQWLIRASELTALGFTAGNMTAVAIDIAATGSPATLNNFTIKLANTSATTLTTTYTADALTTVWGPSNYTPVAGLNTHTFTTPFVWDGTSSLVIDVCFSNQANGSTSATNTYTNPGFSCGLNYGVNGNVIDICGTTNTLNASLASRPNLVFTGNTAAAASAYSWSDGTNTIGNTSSLSVNPTSNTSYTATLTSSGCTIVSNTVTINTLTLPPMPAGNNSSQCGTGVPPAFVTTGGGGGGFKWYDAQTGGNLLQNGGAAYTSPISSTTHFWVSESNGTCESLRREVIAAVNPPDAVLAAVNNNNPCSNTQVSLSVTQTTFINNNNYTYSWTASPQPGSGLPATPVTGSQVNVTPVTAGTYTYTVTAVDGDCSTTSSVSVTVKVSPTNVVALSSVTPCEGGTTTLSSSATSGLNNLINYTEGFETYPPSGWTFINAGSGNNWVASNTLSTPGPHTGTNAIAYSYNTNFAANAWAITPGQNLIGGTTYTLSFWYNTASISGTYVEKLRVTVGDQATVPEQTTVLWDNNGGANLQNETYAQAIISFTPSTNGVYYFGFNCYSAKNKNILYIDDISFSGGTNPASTFSWVSDPAGFTSSVQNPVTPVVVNVPTIFTVTTTNAAGCSASGSVTVTPHPLPPVPSATNGTDQCGTGISDASVSSNNLSDPQSPPLFNWYLVPTGGSPVQTSTSTTYLSSVSVTTTFYVSEVSANGCEGSRVSTTTIVSDPDPITVTATQTNICLGGSTNISSAYAPDVNAFATFDLTASGGAASGITGTVSLSPNGTGTDPYTVTPTAAGTYTYTITAFDPDKGCTSVNSVVVTVNVNPTITAAGATPSTPVCSGASVNLLATTTTVAAGTRTIGSGTSSNSTSTTIGTFYASYYGNGHTQILYTAAELQAAGLSAGNITSLGVVLSSIGTSPVTINGFTIKMAHTSATAITTFQAPSFTTVYGPVNYTPVVGTNTNTFTTPFVWNGVSNIIVDYCFANGISGTSSNTSVNTYTTTAFGSFVNYQADGVVADPCANTSVSNTSSNRPNLVFAGQIATAGAGGYSWTWNPGNLSGNSVTVNPTVTTTYTATATFNGCSTNSNPVTVTVTPVGANATANPSTPVCAGTSVTLNGGATGGGPFTYSWTAGAGVIGTAGTLTISPTVTTTYTVTVKDNCNNSTTSSVTVTVNPLPTASIAETGPITVCAPATPVLTAVSNAGTATYQWKLNGTNISGATGPTYTVTASGSYTVVVTQTSTGCSSAASAPVSVTINPLASAISVTPATNTICNGSVVNLVATVGAVNSTSGTGASTSDGSSTSSTLGPNPLQIFYGGDKQQSLYLASELSALGMNAGSSITAIKFNLVSADPSVSLASLRVKMKNTTTSSLTTTFEPSMTIVRAAAAYAPVVGINTLTLSTPFVWDGTSNLVVEVTYSNNNSGTSGSIYNTAKYSPTAFSSTILYRDDNASAGSFNTYTGAPTYSYSARNDMTFTFTSAIAWTPSTGLYTNAGATTAYTGTNVTSVFAKPSATTTYTVTASTAAGCATTATAAITVNPRPTGTISGSGTYCNGQSTTTALSIAVTGAGPWSGTLLPGNIPFSGSTSPISVSVTPSATTTYTIATLNGSQCSAIAADLSGSATVTINPRPTGVISGSGTYCNGQSTTTALSITVTGAGPWSGTLSNGTAFSGSTSPISVSVTPSATTTYTIATLNGSQCSAIAADLSGSAIVTVNARPTATLSGSGTYCNGQSTTTALSIAVTGAGPWSGTLLPGNIPFSGTTSPISVNVTPSATTTYTLATLNGSQCSAIAADLSGSATVTINPRPTGVISGSGTYCNGQSTTTALSIAVTGAGPWSGTLSDGTAFSGSTSPISVNVTPSSTTTYTIATLNGSQCSSIAADLSGSAIVTINSRPTGVISGSGTYCNGQSTTTSISIAVTGSGPWSGTLSDGTAFSGSTSPISVSVTPSATTIYTIATLNGSQCSATAADLSGSATVTINPRPTGILSGEATYCNGVNTTTALSIAVTGAGPWSGTLSDGTAFSGTTSPISVNVTPSATTTYTIATLNGSQCSAIAADLSGSATVTINPRPTGTLSGSGTYCNGQSTTTSLSIAVTGAGPWSGTLSDGTVFSGSTSPISVSVTPSATTTYTIATLNGSQCSAIAADLSGSATVMISPRPAGTISGDATYCNGQSTTTALSIAVTGAGPWSGTLLPGNIPFSGTTSPISVSVTPSANTTYTIATLNGSQCSATAADLSGSATITVNPRPTATISGSGAFCQGAANTSTNLTVNFTGTAPWNYTYQVNNGSPVSGTTSSNPLTMTVAPSSATAGLFTYTISALSDALCTATDGDWSGSGTVTINPLAATPTATVTQPTCALGTGSITMTAPLGTGNSYTLDGTTTITWPTITFTGVAPGPHTITVSNSFGCSAPASASVTVNPQPFTPTAPVVTGTVNICPHIGTGEQITYTATANGNGNMSFSWTLPPNVNVVSGLGTGTLVVTFPSAAIITQANKQIRVTATNQCGTSTMTIFYLLTQQPNTANPISGPTDVCPLLGNAAGADYVINKAPGALSYLWSAQQSANVTITHPNGTGVNDTIIHVVFATGFTTSNITVQAVNDCGTSGARSLTVYRITPSTPGLIAGPTNACEFTAPNGTAATYSVAATPGVTYTWTVPSGATGLTGQGTSTISFTYPAGFTSGTISVTATNGCGGPSAPRSLSITKLNPATPSVIDVIQTHFCGENPVGNSRVYTYTLASMPANATSVQWVVPSGASLEGGQGSTSITVRYPDAAVNGAVTAQAVNNCGTSTIRSTVVKLPACPVGFTKAEEPANSNVQPKVKTVAPVAVAGASMEVKIFPNPTVSDFKLEVLTPGKEEINVRVIDAQGRMYKSFKLMPYQTIALGAELKAGSYLVEVRQGATVKTTKVIKF